MYIKIASHCILTFLHVSEKDTIILLVVDSGLKNHVIKIYTYIIENISKNVNKIPLFLLFPSFIKKDIKIIKREREKNIKKKKKRSGQKSEMCLSIGI